VGARTPAFDSYSSNVGALVIYQNYGFVSSSPSDTCKDLIHLRNHPDRDRRRNCLELKNRAFNDKNKESERRAAALHGDVDLLNVLD